MYFYFFKICNIRFLKFRSIRVRQGVSKLFAERVKFSEVKMYKGSKIQPDMIETITWTY